MSTIKEPKETIIPQDLTVADVMKSKGGELTQQQFVVLATGAMKQAEDTAGDCQAKWNVFSKTLVDSCTDFGDPIARRFILVANSDVVGSARWWFNPSGQRLDFLYTGAEKYRYLAVVF
jgi:hypothetical protein